MTAFLTAHAEHFRKQADWCERLGSPFNAALLRGLADRIGAGGIVDRLLTGSAVPLSPGVADVAPLRIAGALHALVLSGEDRDLAAVYPAANPGWSMAEALPVALAALERHEGWCAGFLQCPPQTNETRRSIGLLAGFARLEGPLHLLEVGASAGLNQHWDAFGYETASWRREGMAGAPVITTDWTGPAPELPARFDIASRAACDQFPIDIRLEADRVRLAAYIWPDQIERLQRLEAAIAIGLARGISLDRANAADWLEQRLAGPLPEGTTVVYHSIAWQYFDPDTHARAIATIEAAGAGATPQARLAWLRFEHRKVFDRDGDVHRGSEHDHIVDLVTWPGGHHEEIARMDPHGLTLRATPPFQG